jgi:hypothetical protein
MTEAEWLACTDPQRMLEFLRGKVSDRKLRLFALAGTHTPAWWTPFLKMFNRHAAFEALAGGTPAWRSGTTAERVTQAALLRDLFGNPFRPVALDSAWLAWQGGTIPKLAQAIYDDRAFDRLPVLADALLDAGCEDADLLGHLRGPGPHVRGCWPVDLLLGKG